MKFRENVSNDFWPFFLKMVLRKKTKQKVTALAVCLRLAADSGLAPPAGSLTVVGEDGASSGHEVPRGEAVQLPGKPAEHLLLRPAASQEYVDYSLLSHSSVFTNCGIVSFKSLYKPQLHLPKQKVPCGGGSPAPRLLSQRLTAARWRRRLCVSCALCTASASGTP